MLANGNGRAAERDGRLRIAAAWTRTPPGRVYNVGGGHRTSLNRALEVLAGVVGHPLDIRHGARESGDVQDTGAETGRARAELGFNPATTLEDGLAAELEWVRERAEPAPLRTTTLTAS